MSYQQYSSSASPDVGLDTLERLTSDQSTQEVELYETARERDMYESGADLYAIILATEHLERAYARDAVTNQEVRRIAVILFVQHQL